MLSYEASNAAKVSTTHYAEPFSELYISSADHTKTTPLTITLIFIEFKTLVGAYNPNSKQDMRSFIIGVVGGGKVLFRVRIAPAKP